MSGADSNEVVYTSDEESIENKKQCEPQCGKPTSTNPPIYILRGHEAIVPGNNSQLGGINSTLAINMKDEILQDLRYLRNGEFSLKQGQKWSTGHNPVLRVA